MMRVVPFRRMIRRNSRGKDVIAVKRALAKAGYLDWQPKLFTRLYGPFTVQAVKKFQKAHGLHQTGVYDKTTHKKLAPYFDAYGAALMGTVAIPELPPLRSRILNVATLLHNRREIVHYTQTARRMQIVRHKMSMRDISTAKAIYEDCSSSVTGCYYVAGAPDPNGLRYNGTGYTGTLGQHGRSVSLARAKPGDLVFYGRGWPYQHVAMYLGHNLVWSHGSEGGPYAPVAIDYRHDRAIIKNYLGD